MNPCRACLSAVAALLLLLPLSTHAGSPRTLTATVERASDGDTVIATSANGTKIRLRLLGIDAPEIPHGRKPGQPFGVEARDYFDHLIGGKTVRVNADGLDRYKRIPAVVFGSQVTMSPLMVATGYAEVCRGAPRQTQYPELTQAEREARCGRAGMRA